MTREMLSLSNDLFDCCLLCPYKVHLRLSGIEGMSTEYALLGRAIDETYRTTAQRRLARVPEHMTCDDCRPHRFSDLNSGPAFLFNVEIEVERLTSKIDAVRKADGRSQLGHFHYQPLLFCRDPRVGEAHKLQLAYRALVLGKAQGRTPERGTIVYGPAPNTSTISLTPRLKKVLPYVESVLGQIDGNSPPHLLLNRHCDVCEYKNGCRQEAQKSDHLSLLRGISEKEVAKHNSKGIFTVSQLSYTFRPRRHQYRQESPPPHSYALQALSLREEKVHVNGQPKMPLSDTRIYVDIEGDPGRDLYYLIGVLADVGGHSAYHSFWANEECDQAEIVEQFARFMNRFSGYRLYHYGSYDIRALKTMRSQVAACNLESFDRCIENAVNILPIIYHHFYFPVYSNSLKDVAHSLGFRWACANPNAQQTIVWRHRWEQSKNDRLKKQLLDYNQDDCLALREVVKFMETSLDQASGRNDRLEIGPGVVRTDDMLMPDPYPQLFQRTEFEIPEWNYINECAYFDYQRDRVYLRTNPALRRIVNRNARSRSPRHRLDKMVEIEVKACLKCGGEHYVDKGPVSKAVVDLKFMRKGGVKKWIVKYRSRRSKCSCCGAVFVPSEYARIPPKYGHSLVSWCVYQHVERGQPMQQVGRSVEDVFGISVPSSILYRFKMSVADYYAKNHMTILERLISGEILHVDETPVKTTNGKGYVWVFAGIEDVFFMYRPSREADFLKDVLRGFSGVLISDFYSGYDSLECEKQRCLIHLIRDLNADLRKNPFDQEYRSFIRQFSTLLREIVETIDRYGLKKRHLRRFQRRAEQFVKFASTHDYLSAASLRYRDRFRRYGGELFTFLDHDGVPWNNNNAEHAIRHFARVRTRMDGQWSEKSLEEYLVMLSVFKSCELRGVNVLRFLLEAESDGCFWPQNT